MSSRTRRSLLAVLPGVLLVASLGPAPPSAADMVDWWEYDEHGVGMPTTTDPARTLVRASAERGYEGAITEAEVSASVELAAEPDLASDATLRLLFGVASSEGCDPRWEFSLSTYDPGEGGTRDGTTVHLRQPVEPDDEQQWTCSFVELTEPGSPAAVLDRLEGDVTTVIVDPAPGIVVRSRDDGRMAVRRWDALRLYLYPRNDATRVVVDGWSKKAGVRVRPVILDADELGYQRIWAWLPVRLMVAEPRTLVVRARAWNSEGERIGLGKIHVRLGPRR